MEIAFTEQCPLCGFLKGTQKLSSNSVPNLTCPECQAVLDIYFDLPTEILEEANKLVRTIPGRPDIGEGYVQRMAALCFLIGYAKGKEPLRPSLL